MFKLCLSHIVITFNYSVLGMVVTSIRNIKVHNIRINIFLWFGVFNFEMKSGQRAIRPVIFDVHLRRDCYDFHRAHGFFLFFVLVRKW